MTDDKYIKEREVKDELLDVSMALILMGMFSALLIVGTPIYILRRVCGRAK